MKILQLGASARLGGAGIAAYRLHRGLRLLGEGSMMLANNVGQPEANLFGPANTLDKINARAAPLIERATARLSRPPVKLLSSAWVPDRLPARVKALQPDILNLHWMNDNFMRIETLPQFAQPIVWTLHDMWPFAGGEHYVGESQRYREGYRAENRPAKESGLDLNRWVWKRKRKSWSKLTDMVIAAPSQWMAECASNSVLFSGLRVEVLPNGVDHERFLPMDHNVVRRILGLPEDKKLLLFGAGSATSDRRKGFHLLVEALHKLEASGYPDDYELVVFGASSGDASFSIKTHYLGKLQDEISMALVYAAADVFVAPSLEDNLPNTVLESLSCGTPVAAFNIGGMPDMIVHQENGYLATAYDTSELAHGLRWILDDRQRWNQLSKQARRTVEEGFTLRQAAQRYRALYREVLKIG